YSFNALEKDAVKIFPGKTYKAVCFGNPTPAVDPVLTNNYVSKGAAQLSGMFPLMIAGKGMLSGEEIEKTLIEGKFLGFKVFLDWWGDDYGDVTIEDMLSPIEMKIADKYKLIVLLHVPRSDRLANPVIQQGIRKLSENYPNSQIVLAHCGRCYLPDEMKLAAPSIRDLPNVSLDSSMVMDPTALEILLDNVDSKRLLFATDFPVPAMRGRRVYVMDHWVDLVLEGYPDSAYRVQSDNMRASFMVYEIVLAILRAAERVKLTDKEVQGIFHDNGMKILNNVTVPVSI
ncbi:MAG: amidohydrolase, partial [Spirochaetales bacterium]|nr:amidohydrolase [Spirochaetales bacterium]